MNASIIPKITDNIFLDNFDIIHSYCFLFSPKTCMVTV